MMHTKGDSIRTYKYSKCAVFRKTKEKYGGLSNMASGYPLIINNINILSSEALYQACRFPNHADIQRLIISQRSPMTAKMFSKKHIKKTRKDWYSVRYDIMKWCLRIKLAQNWEAFSTLLRSTIGMPIVEESKKDKVWGATYRGDDILKGINALGRLLMDLREDYVVNNTKPITKVDTLNIENFVLYNIPILDYCIVPKKENVNMDEDDEDEMPKYTHTKQEEEILANKGRGQYSLRL